MPFPMIETGYKPEFSLGALYQGENAAAAQQSQTQEIIKQALENIQKQVSFPIEIDNKRANTDYMTAMAEKMRKDATNPYAKAQGESLGLEMFNPMLAGALANKEEQSFDFLMQDPNTPESVKRMVRQLPVPLRRQFLESYHKNMPVNRQVAGMANANTSANAKLGAAELSYHAAKYRTDVMARIAEIKAAQGNKESAMTTDKLVAQMVKDDVESGKITPQIAINFLTEYRASSAMAKPASGISPTIDESGKFELKPKPQPSAPKYPVQQTTSQNNDPLGIR